jgi:hypothetical protein
MRRMWQPRSPLRQASYCCTSQKAASRGSRRVHYFAAITSFHPIRTTPRRIVMALRRAPSPTSSHVMAWSPEQ